MTQGLWFALAISLGFAALALAPGALPAYFAALGVTDAAIAAHGCAYLKVPTYLPQGRDTQHHTVAAAQRHNKPHRRRRPETQQTTPSPPSSARREEEDHAPSYIVVVVARSAEAEEAWSVARSSRRRIVARCAPRPKERPRPRPPPPSPPPPRRPLHFTSLLSREAILLFGAFPLAAGSVAAAGFKGIGDTRPALLVNIAGAFARDDGVRALSTAVATGSARVASRKRRSLDPPPPTAPAAIDHARHNTPPPTPTPFQFV